MPRQKKEDPLTATIRTRLSEKDMNRVLRESALDKRFSSEWNRLLIRSELDRREAARREAKRQAKAL